MKVKGIIKTEIRVKAELTDVDDKLGEFRFRFAPKDYASFRRILDMGAPLYFAIQKDGKDK